MPLFVRLYFHLIIFSFNWDAYFKAFHIINVKRALNNLK